MNYTIQTKVNKDGAIIMSSYNSKDRKELKETLDRIVTLHSEAKFIFIKVLPYGGE